MMDLYIRPDYEVVRNQSRCIACRVCARQCATGVHSFPPETAPMDAHALTRVKCTRCARSRPKKRCESGKSLVMV